MDDADRKIFLDTNVLIYAYSNTEAEKKARIVSLLEDEVVCLSTQVINEFVWVMNKKFGVGMEFLRDIVKNLFELYDVALINDASITKAIDISSQLKFPYWDSLIVASALGADCNVLCTEDLQDGQVIEKKLTVKNPFVS